MFSLCIHLVGLRVLNTSVSVSLSMSPISRVHVSTSTWHSIASWRTYIFILVPVISGSWFIPYENQKIFFFKYGSIRFWIHSSPHADTFSEMNIGIFIFNIRNARYCTHSFLNVKYSHTNMGTVVLISSVSQCIHYILAWISAYSTLNACIISLCMLISATLPSIYML